MYSNNYIIVDSDESIYLLATCYYRSGKPSQAYTILSGKKIVSEKCKFLLARCCVDLHKYVYLNIIFLFLYI